MIPRYQGDTTTEQAQPRGGRQQQRKRDGHDYLKADDLSTDAKTAKILAVRLQDDNFKKSEKVVMTKITLDGHIKMWPLRLNNPNLEILQNAFGSDENEWLDKKILLSVEEDEFDGRHWIRVSVPDTKDSKDGKRKR